MFCVYVYVYVCMYVCVCMCLCVFVCMYVLCISAFKTVGTLICDTTTSSRRMVSEEESGPYVCMCVCIMCVVRVL